MAIDRNETRELIEVVERTAPPAKFLLDRFFTKEHLFDTEKVDFDKVERLQNRQLAPFVSPDVKSPLLSQEGFQVESFTPAYIKMRHKIRPSQTRTRRPGEPLGGNMSPEQRKALIIEEKIQIQRDMLHQRLEYMAAELLTTGKVTVSGEGYQTQVVDYGRDPALTVALTGGARWGETGVSVIDAIEDLCEAVQSKSHGYVPTDVILSPKAARLLRKDKEFYDSLEIRRGAGGEMEYGPIVVDQRKRYRDLGVHGDFHFWVFQDTWRDKAGVVHTFLPEYGVIMVPPDWHGWRLFGGIEDFDHLLAIDYFPQILREYDPAAEHVIGQSAPLLAPGEENAVGFIEVHDGLE